MEAMKLQLTVLQMETDSSDLAVSLYSICKLAQYLILINAHQMSLLNFVRDA